MSEWVGNNSGAVALVSIALVGGLVRFIYWMASVNAGRNTTKDDADKDRSSFKDAIVKLESMIQVFMGEVREDIKQILVRLPPPTVAGSSPVQLTDFGEKVSDYMSAKVWAEELAPALVHEVENKPEFEVDEYCHSYVREQLDESGLHVSVSASAYNFGIERDGVLSVLQVVLRNTLLGVVMNKSEP